MVDPLEIRLIDIPLRPKGPLVQLLLGALVYERAIRSRKRRFIVVVFKEILAHFRTIHLKEIAQAPTHWIVTTAVESRLEQIPHPQQRTTARRVGKAVVSTCTSRRATYP